MALGKGVYVWGALLCSCGCWGFLSELVMVPCSHNYCCCFLHHKLWACCSKCFPVLPPLTPFVLN